MCPILVRARRPVAAALPFIVLLAGAAAAPAQPVVYNLANDWSDTANPNGVWSYNAAPGMPLTNHFDNYVPGQPAWAYAVAPNPGHIPVFYKAVAAAQAPDDLPQGRVDVHNNDPSSSPSGLANSPAGFAWTAPAAGAIQITGGMWEVQRYLGR